MDQQTKELAQMLKDKAVVKVAQVIIDLQTGQANDQTVQTAAAVEQEHPDLWRKNQWLRMVGGTARGAMDGEWIAYLKAELDSEMLEPSD